MNLIRTAYLFILSALVDCLMPGSIRSATAVPKIISASTTVANINNGGCGYFALYLHRYYDQRGIKNEIVYLESGHEIPKHVMVRCDGRFVDASGYFIPLLVKLFYKKVSVHTEAQLVELLTRNGWNDQFKKSDTNTLKKIFE